MRLTDQKKYIKTKEINTPLLKNEGIIWKNVQEFISNEFTKIVLYFVAN
jgi:hypothetical protein